MEKARGRGDALHALITQSGRPGRLTGKDGVFSAALPHCPARDA